MIGFGLIDRRRLGKRLGRDWHILAVVVAISGIVLVGWRGVGASQVGRELVARVQITIERAGAIDEQRLADLPQSIGEHGIVRLDRHVARIQAVPVECRRCVRVAKVLSLNCGQHYWRRCRLSLLFYSPISYLLNQIGILSFKNIYIYEYFGESSAENAQTSVRCPVLEQLGRKKITRMTRFTHGI